MESTRSDIMEFYVHSGSIRVSDPFYNGDEPDGLALLLRSAQGLWHAHVEISNMENWGSTITSLSAESIFHHISAESKTRIRRITTDSGQAGIFDSFIYPERFTGFWYDPDSFFGLCCAATRNEKQYGIIMNKGVVSSSGFGSDEYDVIIYSSLGLVTKIEIIFVKDDNSEKEENAE